MGVRAARLGTLMGRGVMPKKAQPLCKLGRSGGARTLGVAARRGFAACPIAGSLAGKILISPHVVQKACVLPFFGSISGFLSGKGQMGEDGGEDQTPSGAWSCQGNAPK